MMAIDGEMKSAERLRHDGHNARPPAAMVRNSAGQGYIIPRHSTIQLNAITSHSVSVIEPAPHRSGYNKGRPGVQQEHVLHRTVTLPTPCTVPLLATTASCNRLSTFDGNDCHMQCAYRQQDSCEQGNFLMALLPLYILQQIQDICTAEADDASIPPV